MKGHEVDSKNGDTIEKLDMASMDIAEEKQNELLSLFPEAATEDGKVDFEKLKLALGEDIETNRERFGMTWPGKTDCFKAIQTPSMGTLLPCPDESIDFENTENMIIEGDNLEVLKLLQKSYMGKIKMIYIDPPYNTGNDFIYPDNYSESLQTYLQYTGQVDAEGKKFSTNTDTSGRFHSKWLNMMYPRLYLARNLLREDGVIFISIDDSEVSHLKILLDEIFGQENFISLITVVSNPRGRDYGGVAKMHEYLAVVGKSNSTELNSLFEPDKVFPYEDQDGGFELRELRNRNIAFNSVNRPNLFFPIFINPSTQDANGLFEIALEPHSGWIEVLPKESQGFQTVWRWGKDKIRKDAGKTIAGKAMNDGGFQIVEKYRKKTKMARSVWADKDCNTEKGTLAVKSLFSGKKVYSFPKPVEMIMKTIEMGISNIEEMFVLDFFAGSGTTGHAALQQNEKDGGKRKFILVQLPEPLDPRNADQTAGADFCDSIGKPRNIAELTKERMRRAIKKINDEEEGQLDLEAKKQDRGFKVFKLAESNFVPWDSDAPKDKDTLERQLDLHIEHILKDRSQEDILCEILLKSGFELTTTIEKISVAGKEAYKIADGIMLVCLENELSQESIRAMAELTPERIVCLDVGFKNNDQLKANAAQLFKTKNITFKTV